MFVELFDKSGNLLTINTEFIMKIVPIIHTYADGIGLKTEDLGTRITLHSDRSDIEVCESYDEVKKLLNIT